MILYSAEENITVPTLYGVWEDFMVEFGHCIPDEQLRTHIGEVAFLSWLEKKWNMQFEYEGNEIKKITLSDKDYTLMLLKYTK